MKNLLLILAMFISSITFAQECFPECPDPVVFEFDCEINPLGLTDAEIDLLDRWKLLQALVGLTTSKGNTITAVEDESSEIAFIIRVRDSDGGSFTKHPGGDEPILDEIHPETFRVFYRAVLYLIQTDF